MSTATHKLGQHYLRGFTLIELLLYVAIVGGLLTAITMFFAMTAEARVKSQSISEVDQQGTFVMEQITQTIRNADSITSPAAGATAASLTLAVPTPALSPTIINASSTGSSTLGYSLDGGSTDVSNSNVMNAVKFTAGATGTISALNARIGTVAASPNNKGQMAIYSGSSPSTLLASSADTTLTANAWNTFNISPVSVTSGQIYWLAYNTNGISSTDNGLRYHLGAANQSVFLDRAYGTWPNSWTGTLDNFEFSMYATINIGGSVSVVQIKEGTGATMPLLGSKVQVSNLTFKNLSRSGTPGLIQVSFTISRINTANRNEYDYQKTFISSIALRWP